MFKIKVSIVQIFVLIGYNIVLFIEVLNYFEQVVDYQDRYELVIVICSQQQWQNIDQITIMTFAYNIQIVSFCNIVKKFGDYLTRAIIVNYLVVFNLEHYVSLKVNRFGTEVFDHFYLHPILI